MGMEENMNPLTLMVEHELQNTHPDDYGIIIAKLVSFIREKMKTMHGWSDEMLAMEMTVAELLKVVPK
jgi:hypothetical protein